MKDLTQLALNITEEEYRNLPALHHSLISHYDKNGFDALLDENSIKSPSMIKGSIVDVMLTGTEEEFDSKYVVADIPKLGEKELTIANNLLEKCQQNDMMEIPIGIILDACNEIEYYPKWKDETRVNTIITKCNPYYLLMSKSRGKQLISPELYKTCQNCVDAIMKNDTTRIYFEKYTPFSNRYNHYFQLKFCATIDDIEYAIMPDAILVDHEKKEITLVDLKTGSCREWNFFKTNFLKYGYSHQARLYWRIMRIILDNDDEYKDYTLNDFLFIIINEESLTPLIWKFKDCSRIGTIYVGKNKDIELHDPCELGTEIMSYDNNLLKVPNGITVNEPNDLEQWLNTL